MLTLSNKIVSFLKPLVINPNINSFDELKTTLKEIPKYTLLPIDFFEKFIFNIPNYNIISRGDWVEIGVWKGGGALFFKAVMQDLKIQKHLFLFDSFGRIPLFNINHQKDIEFITQLKLIEFSSERSYKQEVIDLFEEFELNEEVSFIECDINSLPEKKVPKTISFLHLDVDFYEPTLSSLNLFYDKILKGGIIIIDDYFMEMFNCKSAVDDFFKSKKINLNDISFKFSSYSLIIIKP